MQNEIDTMVLERQRTLNNEMFDNQKKGIEDDSENQIKKLQDTFSDKNIAKIVAESMKTGIIKDIDGQMKSLKDLYVTWANEFGDGLSIVGNYLESTFIKDLGIATDNAKNLQSIFKDLGVMNLGNINTGSFDNLKNYLGQIDATSILPSINSNLVLPTNATTGFKVTTPNNITIDMNFSKLVEFNGDIGDMTAKSAQTITDVVSNAIDKLKTDVNNSLSKAGVVNKVF